MSFQDVIQFIKESPACIIATVEGDQPRARGMVVLWAREDFYKPSDYRFI